jgi:DNA-binding CsgD family transcriptional regulator
LRALLVSANRDELERLRQQVAADDRMDIAGERVLDEGGAPVAPFDVVVMGPLAWSRWASAALPMARTEDDRAPVVIEALTPREHDVLALVADGLPNREIARQLGISEHTVKFHLASVFGKLGASSRTEAVQRALRMGLIHI